MQSTQTGTVKWFDDSRGIGWIQPDDGGEDVFLHISELEGGNINWVPVGQRVEYGVIMGPKGEQAVQIRLFY